MAANVRAFVMDRVLNPEGPVLTRLAFSPDGDRLAMPDRDGATRILLLSDLSVQCELRVSRTVKLLADGVNLPVNWSNKAFWVASWSPDSRLLALAGRDNTVHVFDLASSTEIGTMVGHSDDVHAVGWGFGDTQLFSASYDGSLKLWDVASGKLLRTIQAHSGRIEDGYWEPDTPFVVTGGRDGEIRIWDIANGALVGKGSGHQGFVLRLLAARLSSTVLSASTDHTVRVWDRTTMKALHVIQGFTGHPHDLSLSRDEYLLAVKDDAHTIRIFRTDTWELIEAIDESADHHHWYGSARFHPKLEMLFTTGNGDRNLTVWNYDSGIVDRLVRENSATRYANCRVGLLGNTGVGKSALARALREQSFQPTESTHGTRSVLMNRLVDWDRVREIYLWDFAGQPTYRLLQRLDVAELALAVLVLDNRNGADPIAEVREWEVLLRAHGAAPARIVVIARTDRGSLNVPISEEQWRAEIRNFAGIVETSAKTGEGIGRLRKLIIELIDWSSIPTVTSDAQFQRLRMFILQCVESGRILDTVHALHNQYVAHCRRLAVNEPQIEEFRTLLGFLDTEGLVKRIGFGNLILLEPGLLRSYASLILIAAQQTGDGTLSEDDILGQRVVLGRDDRIEDTRREPDLLHAAIQEFLDAGVVVRDEALGKLCFPSAVRRLLDEEKWNSLAAGGAYSMSAIPEHVFATMVVTLTATRLFSGYQLFTLAARFSWQNGHGTWVRIKHTGNGQIHVELRHEPAVHQTQRNLFDEVCHTFLVRTARDGEVRAEIKCPRCFAEVDHETARRRGARGFTWISCVVCDERIPLARTSNLAPQVEQITLAAERARSTEIHTAEMQLKEKREIFDVFVSYNREDEFLALNLARGLMARGIRPWVDIWHTRPGEPWLVCIQEQIESIGCAIVLIGESGASPWQHEEMWYLLQQFFSRRCPVIPILLQGTVKPAVPSLLQNMEWIDFSRNDPDPMDRLVWAITGNTPRIGGPL